MDLPASYAWLNHAAKPKMLIIALELFGTKEKEGPGNNPVILAWAKEIGIRYEADSIPWCGLFMATVAHRAKEPLPKIPLRAASWGSWGVAVTPPCLGDVLVFSRKGGGHVGLYVAEDYAYYHVLGGNQGDAVSITRIEKGRLQHSRRAPDAHATVSTSQLVSPGVLEPFYRTRPL